MSATLTPCAPDAAIQAATPVAPAAVTTATAQPVHFHAPHKSPKANARVAQRVWSVAEIAALLELPFNDLMFQAQTIHRAHFEFNRTVFENKLIKVFSDEGVQRSRI